MKSKNGSSRICFVLPHANPKGHDHFDHVRALAREVGRIRPHGARVLGLAAGEAAEPGRWRRTIRVPLRWLRAVQALDLARKNDYSVFFVHYSYLGLLAARWVTRRRGGRTIFWHCGEPWLYAKEDPWGSGAVLRAVLRSADLVLTGSPSLREGYVAHFGLEGRRVAVLPSWVEPWLKVRLSKPRLRSKLGLGSAEEKIVLFAHRLSPDRGCLLLPEIIGRLRERVPRVRLLVVGDGPARADLQREATQRGVADRIHFCGWVPHSEIKYFYAAADVLIVPSLRAGVPRNILEAFASGLPVVSTRAGGTADLFRGRFSPFCVSPGSAEALATAAGRLLNEPKLSLAFVAWARRAAAPHHVHAVASDLIRLIDESGR